MSEELKPCPFCGYEPETREVHVYPNGEKSPASIKCKRCNYHLFGYNEEALFVHWNCRPIENTLRDELKYTDLLLKEATETIGAVVACCTYNSNDDAKIGIYGIDQKAFTRIDQFITHYNDTISAGKVSVDVKTSTDNNKRSKWKAYVPGWGAPAVNKRYFVKLINDWITIATYYLRVGGGYWKDDSGQELADGVVSLWKGLEE